MILACEKSKKLWFWPTQGIERQKTDTLDTGFVYKKWARDDVYRNNRKTTNHQHFELKFELKIGILKLLARYWSLFCSLRPKNLISENTMFIWHVLRFSCTWKQIKTKETK